MFEKDKHNIIVSLTSYPERIVGVSAVVKTLLIQTNKPDKIILWLAEEQFPNKNEDLPQELNDLCQYGLEIEWVKEDLKSHKKYFYAMKKFPEDIIITVDDDMYYHPETIECLYKSYIEHPNAISCTRCNLISKTNGKIAPYSSWKKNYPFYVNNEAMDLLAVGCGGVLYPPGCLNTNDLYDVEVIRELCLFQDDLWLKVNEVIRNIPTILVEEFARVKSLPILDSQKTALCETVNIDGNDLAINKLDAYVKLKFKKFLVELIFENEMTVDKWIENKKRIHQNIFEQISEGKCLYIYGAGEGAKSTMGCLSELKMSEYIKGFIVTDITKNPLQLFDRDVIQVDKVNDKDCIILVSTAEKLQAEIVALLKEYNFQNILTVCDKVIGDYVYLCNKWNETFSEFWISCKER